MTLSNIPSYIQGFPATKLNGTAGKTCYTGYHTPNAQSQLDGEKTTMCKLRQAEAPRAEIQPQKYAGFIRNTLDHKLRIDLILLYSGLTDVVPLQCKLTWQSSTAANRALGFITEERSGMFHASKKSSNIDHAVGIDLRPILAFCFPNYRRPSSNWVKLGREKQKLQQRQEGLTTLIASPLLHIFIRLLLPIRIILVVL